MAQINEPIGSKMNFLLCVKIKNDQFGNDEKTAKSALKNAPEIKPYLNK